MSDNDLVRRGDMLKVWVDGAINGKTYDEIRIALDKILPADAKPAARSEWKDYPERMYPKRHDYRCSKCGNRADYFVNGMEEWWCAYEPNFCPNCGMPMTEEALEILARRNGER